MSEHLKKPSVKENEFFAAEDVEKKRALSRRQSDELVARQRDELRKLHHMKCPSCGMDLQRLHLQGHVDVDTCFHCHGVWVSAGDLEKLSRTPLQHREGVMDAIIRLFQRA